MRGGGLEAEVTAALGLDSVAIVEVDSISTSGDTCVATRGILPTKETTQRLQLLLSLGEAFLYQSGVKTPVVVLLLLRA